MARKRTQQRTKKVSTKKQRTASSAEDDPNPTLIPWSSLHQSILDHILRRLTLRDGLRFGGACKAWQRAQLARLHGPTQFPWLLLPEQTRSSLSSPVRQFRFLSPSDGAGINVDLPVEMHSMRACSSQGSWLMMCDKRDPKLAVLNAVTKATLDLPSWHSRFPGNDVSFSSDPDASSCFVAFPALHHRIYLCRIGDSVWSYREDSLESDLITSITFCNGKIYGVSALQHLLTTTDPRRSFPVDVVPMTNTGATLTGKKKPIPFLVESQGGVFLVLVALHDGEWVPKGEPPATGEADIEVFKADLERMEWARVTSLGDDRAFFVGRGCCFSASVTEIGGKRNHVHYVYAATHRCANFWYWLDFDLEKGTVRVGASLVRGNGLLHCCKCLWVQPKLNEERAQVGGTRFPPCG